MAVSHSQEEDILFSQVAFNAAHDQGTVGIPNLLQDHSDHISALNPQGPREEIRPIVKGASRGQNSFLRVLRNGMRSRGVIQNS